MLRGAQHDSIEYSLFFASQCTTIDEPKKKKNATLLKNFFDENFRENFFGRKCENSESKSSNISVDFFICAFGHNQIDNAAQ